MSERRKDRILRVADEIEHLGIPAYTLEPIREYAGQITYCTCGHEGAGSHGNGIVDRRCFVAGCKCAEFFDPEER